jgi:putative ABC transport system permease protein
MPPFPKARSFLRNLLSSRRVEVDLDLEVRSYRELLTQEKIRSGLSPQEAERAARLELGGAEQVKERVRDERLGNWLHSVFSDCRYALRQLRKNPGFTAVAIVTLALGIGSTTAIFSTLNRVLLHPYPYKNAERLATFTVFSADQFRAWRFPARAFVDFKENNHTFDDMFGLVYSEARFTRNNRTDEFSGGSVTPGTFESLGIPPLLGRTLIADDFRPDAPPVFIISYSLWTTLFNRDPNVLGMIYTVNGTRTTLVGIMPARFRIGGCDLWLPLNITRDMFVPGAGIQSNEIWTVGHLKFGVSPETAAADLQVIATPFQNDDPIYFPPHFKIVVNTFNSQPIDQDFKLGLFALMAAVVMLLLIACSNVANLLLARATTRQREFGIRSALGASRGRIVRQLLVESFALASAGCALGYLLAFVGLKVMVALIPSGSMPPEAVIALSPAAFLFSLLVTLFTTIACGMAPAVQALQSDPQMALHSAGRGTSADFRQGSFRSTLVVAEVALSIVLAISSGLIMRSLFAIQNVNIGFNPSTVLYAQISWPDGRYDSAAPKNALFRKILKRLAKLPGVLAATETSDYPPYTWGWTTVAVQGQTLPPNRNTASIMCTEGYFQTLNRTLLRGTLFTQQDINSSRRVVVVNQTFVRDHFGEENPIGHQVRFSDFETLVDWPRDPYFEIIGVVADAQNSGLQNVPRPEIYLPASLTSAGPRNLMVLTSSSQPFILQEIRAEFSDLDSNIAVGQTGTIAALLEHDYFARPRFLLISLCSFAGIALVLVAAGVFGVISYSVALQTHEIGVRMALGAQPAQVLTQVLKKGTSLILAGIGIGLVTSYFLTRVLSTQVWGISVTDPSTFVAVALLILLVGLLACLVPARRASRVDPIIALRYE